jgi:hypothetical protein
MPQWKANGRAKRYGHVSAIHSITVAPRRPLSR